MILGPYHGYHGTMEWSEEDNCWHGRLTSVADLITYESHTCLGLIKAFHEAVREYEKSTAAAERSNYYEYSWR